MIDRETLAEALGRLDSRDREVLDFSLRRRVPDNDLAEVFGVTPGEVARMRAAAIERLSFDLGVEGGQDLGGLLRELLDKDTWSDVPGAEQAGPAGRGHSPLGATGSERAPEEALADAPRPEPPEPAEGSAAASTGEGEKDPPREGPVLDMLSGREADAAKPASKPRMRRALAAAAVAIVMLIPAAVVALTSGSSDGDAREEQAADDATQAFKPEPSGGGEPFPSDPKSAYDYPTALVSKKVGLYDEPDGKVKVRLPAKTEWNSQRVMSVVERRGAWLAVLAPELRNGEVGWLRDADVRSMGTVPWSVHVDLSERMLEVRRGSDTVRRARIGVGRVDHPTPPGRYAVTDKLRVSDPGSPYGCCVVALTGHQTKLPDGWPGGDRLAVHATPDKNGLGKAVSLGCMRADPRDARAMMKELPLGTPVFVRR